MLMVIIEKKEKEKKDISKNEMPTPLD